MALGNLREDHILRDVGVLELVHQDVAEPLPIPVPHRVVSLEHPRGLHQQIIEVQPVVLAQSVLVCRVGLRDDLIVVGARGVGLGGQ